MLCRKHQEAKMQRLVAKRWAKPEWPWWDGSWIKMRHPLGSLSLPAPDSSVIYLSRRHHRLVLYLLVDCGSLGKGPFPTGLFYGFPPPPEISDKKMKSVYTPPGQPMFLCGGKSWIPADKATCLSVRKRKDIVSLTPLPNKNLSKVN